MSAFANQIAEVSCLVIEAAMRIRLIELDSSVVNVVNRRASRIPPARMNQRISTWTAEQRIAMAQQVETGMELRHAVLMLRLKESEIVDTP